MYRFPGKKRDIACFSEEFYHMLAKGELPPDYDDELFPDPPEPDEAEMPEPHDEPEHT